MIHINNKEYAWGDITVVVFGRPLVGITGIEYKSKKAKDVKHGWGRNPKSIQHGKREYEGTLTLMQSELTALNRAARAKGYKDILDVDFDIIVTYEADLVVSAFLCFLLLATLCKPTTCKILFRETNPGRDKNGTKPQENKIKNASSPTSLVVDFSFLCKGTILSRELQTKSCKYAAYQTFILHGHFREDTASASCTDLCCLFQRPVKIRFMPFVHYGISADAHCIGQMYNQSAIIRNAECVFYQ